MKDNLQRKRHCGNRVRNKTAVVQQAVANHAPLLLAIDQSAVEAEDSAEKQRAIDIAEVYAETLGEHYVARNEAVLHDVDEATAAAREAERLRPRHDALHVPAAFDLMPGVTRQGVASSLPEWCEPPQVMVQVTPELASQVAALLPTLGRAKIAGPWDPKRDGYPKEAIDPTWHGFLWRWGRNGARPPLAVLPEVAEAVKAASDAMRDAWISILLRMLAETIAARVEIDRNKTAASEMEQNDLRFMRLIATPKTIHSVMHQRLLEGLTVAPGWLSVEVIAWLLDHYAPTKPGSKGGGGRPRKGDAASKLNESTIRGLLKNRHALAKKIEASDPALSARILLET